MGDTVTHKFDVACPYCMEQDIQQEETRQKRLERERKEAAKRRAIIETHQRLAAPMGADQAQEKQELPPWAKKEDQPEHLRKYLTSSSGRRRR